MQDAKQQTRQRFGTYAQGYVTSPIHAAGSDLDRLLDVLAPGRDWRVLDVATGGGHTALKAAPHVAQVVALDFTPAMLDAARAFIAPEAANVRFVGGDAEALPFAAETFDAVTCRAAAHHFPDAYRFALEAARVLKRGGVLLLLDHLLPEHEQAAAYIEAFERLRDPSHGRAYAESGWRGLLLDADFSVEHVETLRREANFLAWAERQGCSPDVVARLQILLAQAPDPVAEWLRPRAVGSVPDATFEHVFILISGRKR